jgi:hypothetical protein
MNRRSVLRSVVAWVGAVAVLGLTAWPAQAYYFFFQYRFSYYVHRNRRRSRWRSRRGR